MQIFILFVCFLGQLDELLKWQLLSFFLALFSNTTERTKNFNGILQVTSQSHDKTLSYRVRDRPFYKLLFYSISTS